MLTFSPEATLSETGFDAAARRLIFLGESLCGRKLTPQDMLYRRITVRRSADVPLCCAFRFDHFPTPHACRSSGLDLNSRDEVLAEADNTPMRLRGVAIILLIGLK